jgi:alpha-glucosidase
MSWTGDNRSSWDHLWLSMPVLMNLGLSGIGHTGPDIGGFSGFASGELFTRWLQMGAFLPFTRAHTFLNSPDQEPWSWGEPYLSINRWTIELRYRLLPYLYTAFWQCAQTGVPIVRPLLLAFQEDGEVHALDDEFMCGDALLVAPVMEEGAAQRAVYVPDGMWYDFWTDEPVRGPTWIDVPVVLERVPVLVRGGSVVPQAPAMAYVGQRTVDRLTLRVYPGHGESELYEDDGHSRAFETGMFRVTRFSLSTEGEPPVRMRLERRGEGPYASQVRAFDLVIHGAPGLPDRTIVDGHVVEGWEALPDRPAVRLGLEMFERLELDWT